MYLNFRQFDSDFMIFFDWTLETVLGRPFCSSVGRISWTLLELIAMEVGFVTHGSLHGLLRHYSELKWDFWFG